MLVHLISVAAVSLATILFAWLVFRWIGRPMPGATVPALLALSAIGYGVYSEYTWATRTMSQFPPEFEVVHRLSGTSPFAPWSYVIPRVDRLSLIDRREVQTHPDHAEMVWVTLYLLQRFEPTRRVGQLLDCSVGRRMDVDERTPLDDSGLPAADRWVPMSPEHPLMTTACPLRDAA